MTARFVVDDLARPLPLAGDGARRIISLAPSCTESLLAIGAADRLVGVEEHSALPPALDAVPRVGGFRDHDLDAIVALRPDLVVAASLHAVRRAPVLAARGIPVFVTQPRTVDGILSAMARLAALAGLARAAAPYLAACRARVDAVLARTLRTRVRPLVYVELGPQGSTGGPQSFVDDLVTKAGGVNLGGLYRVEWPVARRRDVLAHPPDVIVVASWPGSATAADLAARPGWHAIPAVESGRVYEVPAGLVKRPGPSVVAGLEVLAARLA
jgi:iron complex transport system substrate-binding protein